MAKKAGFNPVKSGHDPRNEEKSTRWLNIKDGESVDGIILVNEGEIVSCELCAIWLDKGQSPMWPYTGPDDPSHELSADRRYRAYLPMLVDGEIKVWSMAKTNHVSILDISDASGDLKGLEIRIKRTGVRINTRYSIVPKGKRRDVSDIEEVDVISMLGPLTPEDAREYIAEKLGMSSYEEVLTSFRGSLRTKRGTVVVPSKDFIKEEDDDLEEVELI